MNKFEEMDKSITLGIQIRNLFENKEFPLDLKLEIEKVYREYEQFYDENVKSGIHLQGVENDYEDEKNYTINKIIEDYRNECGQNVEEIIDFINHMEENDTEKELDDTQKQNMIIEYYEEMNKNDNKVNNMVDSVIDSLSTSRDRLFDALSVYTIDRKEKEELDQEIHSIKNRARTRLEEEGKTIFARDEQEIENRIIEIYEECINDKKIELREEEKEQSASEKFRQSYIVNVEDMLPIEEIKEETKNKEVEKEEIKTDIEMI